jgi:hypothetical protein
MAPKLDMKMDRYGLIFLKEEKKYRRDRSMKTIIILFIFGIIRILVRMLRFPDDKYVHKFTMRQSFYRGGVQ